MFFENIFCVCLEPFIALASLPLANRVNLINRKQKKRNLLSYMRLLLKLSNKNRFLQSLKILNELKDLIFQCFKSSFLGILLDKIRFFAVIFGLPTYFHLSFSVSRRSCIIFWKHFTNLFLRRFNLQLTFVKKNGFPARIIFKSYLLKHPLGSPNASVTLFLYFNIGFSF